ncbi:solute carrier organic anion transporter family member 1C1 [Amia ocellicauda]|uniref:solute carrier organic anion transporter family member 1C1 n=1 Tax=Amia ocellicauda TaxID=2972642 RepID=UPI0034646BDE
MTAESRPKDFTEPPSMTDSVKESGPSGTRKCCTPTLKMFLAALAFSFFSKTLSGSYTKSTITQIERRFEISSSVVGIIDGGFEMGNLLVITVVSYFGAKYHRPKLIGAGCLLMSLGTFLMAMPHFFMGRYDYETVASTSLDSNMTMLAPCSKSSSQLLKEDIIPQSIPGCVNHNNSLMWVVVLLGNMLRGIGEATIGPLGMSFIDDFARPENSAFYIGCIHTIAVIGPLFGFTLGSFCAGLYVDIGFVNLDAVTITPKDARWVGAWWLGFIVAGGLSLVTALPFCFLPSSLPEEQQKKKEHSISSENLHIQPSAEPKPSLAEIAKDFGPSLKRLLTNKIFFLILVTNILIFNAFIILITFTPKFLEQQFGQSASTANFLIGVTCMPAVSLGIFFSGYIMKRFKLDMLGAVRVSFCASICGCLCTLPFFALSCKNLDIAGLTVSYDGSISIDGQERSLLSTCNLDCSCSLSQWDPVCGENGVTYISPCFAGCNSTSGIGKNTTFHGCSCLKSSRLDTGKSSAVLGQCAREEKCSTMLYIFLALHSLSFFIFSLGSTPLYIILLRCVEPELKSLSVGVFMLLLRMLGGITAPIYFGALIDATCLKWGSRKCGGKGACRMYNIETFRFLFLGLILSLRLAGYIFFWILNIQIKKKLRNDKKAAEGLELNVKQNS